jgi:hypothetical protein
MNQPQKKGNEISLYFNTKLINNTCFLKINFLYLEALTLKINHFKKYQIMTNFTRFKLLLLALVMLVGSGASTKAQTTIVSFSGGGTLPINWTSANNVITNVIDRDTYYLLDPGNPSDIIESSNYDLTAYSTLTINVNVATFGSGTANSLKIEISFDGGNTWSTTSYFTNTPSSSTYIAGGPIVVTQTFTSNTRIRLTNNGASGRGVRVQNFVLTGTSSTATATPTFTPSTGTYYSTQNVSLSSTTEGATIHYTTDGTDPDDTDATYSTPIAVSTTTTLKAIAYKTDMDPSSVATAVYTFPAINDVSDIATLRAGATDGTVYRLTGEAVLTLKTANRNAKYIQDATGGVLIDDNEAKITTTYNAGDGITGITGTLTEFTGMLQLVPVLDPGTATSTGNVVTAVEVDLADLADYPAQLVKVSGVTISGSGNFTASTSYNLNGTDTTVLRVNYSDLPYIDQAIPTAPQDIVGVVLIYNTTERLVPRTIDDFSNTIFTSPTIVVSETEVPEMSAFLGSTDAETITVNAQNLTANIALAVTGTNASLFTLSTSSITPTDGSVSDVVVTITYTPVEAGSHSATLTLSSAGAESVVKSLSGTATVPPSVPDVIITEVYGGGGNSGAPYTNDFFELYNTTDNIVEIGNWSIQYYSATGTGLASNIISIPSGKTIPVNGHFLIQGSGGATGVALPTPDATGTINASGTSGKVILYTSSVAQTINSSAISSITSNEFFKDYVAYGTAAIPVWGTVMSTNASNTTSAARKYVNNDYVYTQNIGADFESAAPDPQNSLSTNVNQEQSIVNITAFDGKIRFSATAGQVVEVYNAVGQKLISNTTHDGLNTLSVDARGMLIVRIGERVAKVML